ncbi:MAG: site-specific integrase [Sedimenticola sp.]|nr:site-specific integrase [Sedimenticola sp.]
MSDMSQQTHLFKRNSSYYFRAKIPRDLQPYLGKQEEKFSLKTKDYREAKKLVRQASTDFDRRCQQLRGELCYRLQEKMPRVIDDDLIQEICALWRHHTLAGDEYSRQEGLLADELDERAGERRSTREQLREMLRKGQLEAIEPALQVFLDLLGVEPRGDQNRYRTLLYRFLQTVTEVHDQQLARDAGEVIWSPEPPVIRHSSATSLPVAHGPGLDELFEDWKRFNPRRPERTVDDVCLVLESFQQLVGKKGAAAMDRQDIIRYRDHLISQGLRPKTVGKKITFLCTLFNVGINSGKLTVNPAQRIPIPKSDSRSWLPFDLDDLKRIFSSPLYTDGDQLGRGVREASAWLPLLSLYQGCRVEELAQLLVADVQKIDGIHCLIIDDNLGENGKEKRLKNTNSRRRLPLHPVLIEAGFVRYVERLCERKAVQVFPDLKPDRYGKLSAAFSKAFMKYLRKEIGITDRLKVFHSFRHNFRDACREAGLDEEISDALMGHSGTQKMGRRYGNSFSVRCLDKAIYKIDYPGLKIPILIPEEK